MKKINKIKKKSYLKKSLKNGKKIIKGYNKHMSKY